MNLSFRSNSHQFTAISFERTGEPKNTFPKIIAKMIYKPAIIQIAHGSSGCFIRLFNKARPPTRKCVKFPITIGRLYIPPITLPLAIQFSMAKAKYSAPKIWMKSWSMIVEPGWKWSAISGAKKVRQRPIKARETADDAIRSFVFIFISCSRVKQVAMAHKNK